MRDAAAPPNVTHRPEEVSVTADRDTVCSCCPQVVLLHTDGGH